MLKVEFHLKSFFFLITTSWGEAYGFLMEGRPPPTSYSVVMGTRDRTLEAPCVSFLSIETEVWVVTLG